MSCEVMTLQLIFYTQSTPLEYYRAGKRFPFPKPHSCLHPDCRLPIPPRPYGYYSRNIISFGFTGRILIRRYYCPRCGHTFSCLPSFCLPYYQYSLALIWINLLCQFFNLLPFLKALAAYVNWHRQHLQFYRKRFKNNLVFIKLVLRQLVPEIKLPEEMAIRKEAKKVLSIVTTGFPTVQTFSTRFFAQSNKSFMASRGNSITL